MQENEKKKVGFFGKLKNIIFVEEEETDGVLPEYKPEDIQEEKPRVIIHDNIDENKTLPSRLDNDRLLNDITLDNPIDMEEEIKIETKEEIKEKVEEQASPFLSFDEVEFDNYTSRVARNEARMREQAKQEVQQTKERLTYNLPPTNKTTMSSVNNTLVSGKKPFTPSPVISPVYGILDKNYSKEDIIDKRTDRRKIDSFDRVRDKAYGKAKEKENIEEKVLEDIEIPQTKEEKKVENVKVEVEKKVEVKKPEIKERAEDIVLPMRQDKKSNNIDINDINIEEDISLHKDVDFEDDINIGEIVNKHDNSSIEKKLDNMMDDYEEDLVEEEKPSAKLDDLEKTSTLRILDDIEKELNSIKPANGEDEEEKSNQILEKDIFNMISSMYVGGDEEDDSD